jgi:serralysin
MTIKVGTTGADTIVGGAGDDFLYGLGGNDVLQGSLGADTLNGGTGTDIVWYVESGVGVQINLATGQGFGGTAEGDTLISIENLRGSYFGDTLYGNDVANSIYGDQGNDVIGGGGADWLYGADGIDVLDGGDGGDHIDGGTGNDTVAYGGSPEGVHCQPDDGHRRWRVRGRRPAGRHREPLGFGFRRCALGRWRRQCLLRLSGRRHLQGRRRG